MQSYGSSREPPIRLLLEAAQFDGHLEILTFVPMTSLFGSLCRSYQCEHRWLARLMSLSAIRFCARTGMRGTALSALLLGGHPGPRVDKWYRAESRSTRR